MSTYSYTITLNDSEYSYLERMLHYQEEGPMVDRIKQRMAEGSVTQTSGIVHVTRSGEDGSVRVEADLDEIHDVKRENGD